MKARDLLNNVLLRTLIEIKIDTTWRMLRMLRDGNLPDKDDEGATGKQDNKGAIFVPGGVVFEDSDKRAILPEPWAKKSTAGFAEAIRLAMEYDNATLLYHGGIATGVNLDNGFFAEMAGNILATKKMAFKRTAHLGPRPPARIHSDHICTSYTPGYHSSPYGSRTRLSSCLAVALLEPRLYYMMCRNAYGLRGAEEQAFWDALNGTKRQITTRTKVPLAPPAVVVCHTTRYREVALTGLIRILGYGRFGEFATLTFERGSSNLAREIQQSAGKGPLGPRHVLARLGEVEVVPVLRMYSETRPGSRRNQFSTIVFSAQDDLDIDVEAVSEAARESYRV